MGILNQVLCLVQGILDSIFGVLNSALGSFLPADLVAPQIGCDAGDTTA